MAALSLSEFIKIALDGWPIIFLIIGLVEWSKQLKNKEGSQLITGNNLLILSMSLGVFFGVLYMIALGRPPEGGDWYAIYVYWFGVLIYSFVLGIIASGLFDVVRNKLAEIFQKFGYDPRGEG